MIKMKIQKKYDNWADTYDDCENKTRDLEAAVLRKTLVDSPRGLVLEVGCGTGKNTGWLGERFPRVHGVDFSTGMLDKAREKCTSEHIKFSAGDISRPWKSFQNEPVRGIVISLVLEHLEHLDFVFEQAAEYLLPGGWMYVCEFHPFKQYLGSQARFEQDGKVELIPAFVHHTTDYIRAAKSSGLQLVHLEEHWDDDEQKTPPRLISFVFRKEI